MTKNIFYEFLDKELNSVRGEGNASNTVIGDIPGLYMELGAYSPITNTTVTNTTKNLKYITEIHSEDIQPNYVKYMSGFVKNTGNQGNILQPSEKSLLNCLLGFVLNTRKHADKNNDTTQYAIYNTFSEMSTNTGMLYTSKSRGANLMKEYLGGTFKTISEVTVDKLPKCIIYNWCYDYDGSNPEDVVECLNVYMNQMNNFISRVITSGSEKLTKSVAESVADIFTTKELRRSEDEVITEHRKLWNYVMGFNLIESLSYYIKKYKHPEDIDETTNIDKNKDYPLFYDHLFTIPKESYLFCENIDSNGVRNTTPDEKNDRQITTFPAIPDKDEEKKDGCDKYISDVLFRVDMEPAPPPDDFKNDSLTSFKVCTTTRNNILNTVYSGPWCAHTSRWHIPTNIATPKTHFIDKGVDFVTDFGITENNIKPLNLSGKLINEYAKKTAFLKTGGYLCAASAVNGLVNPTVALPDTVLVNKVCENLEITADEKIKDGVNYTNKAGEVVFLITKMTATDITWSGYSLPYVWPLARDEAAKAHKEFKPEFKHPSDERVFNELVVKKDGVDAKVPNHYVMNFPCKDRPVHKSNDCAEDRVVGDTSFSTQYVNEIFKDILVGRVYTFDVKSDDIMKNVYVIDDKGEFSIMSPFTKSLLEIFPNNNIRQAVLSKIEHDFKDMKGKIKPENVQLMAPNIKSIDIMDLNGRQFLPDNKYIACYTPLDYKNYNMSSNFCNPKGNEIEYPFPKTIFLPAHNMRVSTGGTLYESQPPGALLAKIFCPSEKRRKDKNSTVFLYEHLKTNQQGFFDFIPYWMNEDVPTLENMKKAFEEIQKPNNRYTALVWGKNVNDSTFGTDANKVISVWFPINVTLQFQFRAYIKQEEATFNWRSTNGNVLNMNNLIYNWKCITPMKTVVDTYVVTDYSIIKWMEFLLDNELAETMRHVFTKALLSKIGLPIISLGKINNTLGNFIRKYYSLQGEPHSFCFVNIPVGFPIIHRGSSREEIYQSKYTTEKITEGDHSIRIWKLQDENPTNTGVKTLKYLDSISKGLLESVATEKLNVGNGDPYVVSIAIPQNALAIIGIMDGTSYPTLNAANDGPTVSIQAMGDESTNKYIGWRATDYTPRILISTVDLGKSTNGTNVTSGDLGLYNKMDLTNNVSLPYIDVMSSEDGKHNICVDMLVNGITYTDKERKTNLQTETPGFTTMHRYFENKIHIYISRNVNDVKASIVAIRKNTVTDDQRLPTEIPVLDIHYSMIMKVPTGAHFRKIYLT
jgi:hypothetical protein